MAVILTKRISSAQHNYTLFSRAFFRTFARSVNSASLRRRSSPRQQAGYSSGGFWSHFSTTLSQHRSRLQLWSHHPSSLCAEIPRSFPMFLHSPEISSVTFSFFSSPPSFHLSSVRFFSVGFSSTGRDIRTPVCAFLEYHD